MEKDLQRIFGEMVTELKQLRERYPLTILYTDLEVIRYAYRFFECKMGPAQYSGEPNPENRIFAQYHAFYPDDMKEFIVKDLAKERPTIRVVFATVSLGIGLDDPSVRKIIHFKPLTSIAEYVQEHLSSCKSRPADIYVLFPMSEKIGILEQIWK